MPSPSRRPSRLALGVLVATAVATGVSAAPALAQTPTISTGTATIVSTTGAAVTVTVNPNGTDALYQVLYGPTGGGLTSMSGLQDAGSGTAPVVETVPIDQLTPGTSYTFQAQVTEADNGISTTDPTTASFTTTANPTGPGTPIVAPQDPPANTFLGQNCSTDPQCLSDMNAVRALQEGLPPLVLPSNWTTLTPAEQMFVSTNMERVSRGLPAIPDLVNTYDAEVTTGMQTDADPVINENVNGSESIWAGGNDTVLGAMNGWLYADGVGVGNLDCNAPTDPGCWGHRNAILDGPAGTITANEMDAVVGTDTMGSPSYAAAFVLDPNPTPAANVVFTWAAEQPSLAPPALGGAKPHGPAPTLARLTLSPRTLKPLRGRKEPTTVLDTAKDSGAGAVVSYTDSLVATATITIERCVTTTHGAKRTRRTRCTTVGSFTHVDAKGANRFRFTGRYSGKPLAAGAYRLSIAAVSPSGRRGAAVTRAFTVAR